MATGPVAHEILEINVDTTVSSTIVKISADGPIKKESNYQLTSPDRLVVDLPGITRAPTSAVSGDGTRLDQVRVGLHSNKIRLVFDLNYALNASLEKEGSTLKIILAD